MYEILKNINHRPRPFEFSTAEILWNDEHISGRMLQLHLDDGVEQASRSRVAIDRTVAWMADRFEIGPGTRIGDFGCGPGLYATRLAERGARVTGIDFSERSIRYARQSASKKNLDIDYILGNYLEGPPLGTFDLIIMLFCDFGSLSPEQRQNLLRRFFDGLEDEGRIYLDVCTLDGFENREETAVYRHLLHDGFWSAADYYGFRNGFKYGPEKLYLDKVTIVEKTRTWEIFNWMQHFSPESLAREFEECGLFIHEYYPDFAGKPGEDDSGVMAVVAGKS